MVDMIEKLASSTAWNHTAMPSRLFKKTVLYGRTE
jgi:hypothetical protein